MDACSSLGCSILNALLEKSDVLVSGVYNSLMGSWPGLVITTLYILVAGYVILMGRAGERTKDWAISVVLITVLTGFAGSYSTFNEWVGGPLMSIAQKAGALAASGGESSGDGGISGLLDANEQSLGKVIATIDELEVPGNPITNAWLYLKVGVVVFIMTLLACVMYIGMLTLLCIALFSLMMMFMVAGPCLWLASFKETRHITWAWLRASANYTLWVVFIAAVAGVGNRYIAGVSDVLTTWDLERDGVFTKAIGAHMAITAISIYMLLKTSEWAAYLTGGTATQAGVLGALGSMGGSAVSSLANSGGNAAGAGARWGAGVAINRTQIGAAGYRAYSALKGLGRTR